MSELKADIFTRRQVLFVMGRGRKPSDWAPNALAKDLDCPFCEGHEAETPREIWALRQGPADRPGWQIRVIPNKYPIAATHELIIETPSHRFDLPDLAAQQMERVIATYRRRMSVLARQRQLRYLLLFKNHGRAAGASRIHAHAQLVGFPFVPALIAEEMEIAHRAYAESGCCLYCQTIERELVAAERIIMSDDHFLVWSPSAARVPYECWVLPRGHRHDFLQMADEEATALARLLQRTLARLRQVIGSAHWAYNFYLHTVPLPAQSGDPPEALEASYHWHIEILPRLTRLAGLEWGSGLYVNPVSPTEAAQVLRQAAIEPGS